jgi:murein L,D-transpeptidase YafK
VLAVWADFRYLNGKRRRTEATMRAVKLFLMAVLVVGLAACGNSKFKKYRGPEVTSVQVHKADRKMYLLHNDKVLKSYDIALGFAPVGHKQFEGDGKTPEGSYFINRRNPGSEFHLSLGISYPNAADVAAAREGGKEPGGDIFIHGARRAFDPGGADWTWGCISVSNNEIEQIYAMVKNGTQIDLNP